MATARAGSPSRKEPPPGYRFLRPEECEFGRVAYTFPARGWPVSTAYMMMCEMTQELATVLRHDFWPPPTLNWLGIGLTSGSLRVISMQISNKTHWLVREDPA